MKDLISRRALIEKLAARGTLLTATGSLLAACSRLDDKTPFRQLLEASDGFTMHAQRLILAGRPLARELSIADVSKAFPMNGTTQPKG
jgi:hypothetical protein